MRFILAMIFGAFASAAVSAQSDIGEPTDVDRQIFEMCLANEPGRDCIGQVTRACDAEPDATTTVGMISCAGREHMLWDEYLNDRYAAVMEWYAGDQDYNVRQRERVRAAQRIWITLRDADCEVEAGRYDGGSLARVVRAYCLSHAAAERALWLDEQMREG